MPELKIACRKCNAEILGATASKNQGLCAQCVKGTSFEDIADGIAIGMRFLRGIIFSVFFAGLGYGFGSVVGTMTGIFVAVLFAVVGFVYGCFCSEINSLVRTLLSFTFDR